MPSKMDVFLNVFIVIELAWLAWNLACYSRTTKTAIINDGFRMRVKCKKCGLEYEVSAETFLKKHMMKRKFTNVKVEMRGPIMMSQPEQTLVSKKFDCPHCCRREWAEVVNLREYFDRYQAFFVRRAVTQTIIGFGGAALIMVFFNIVSKIAGIQ